MVAPLRVSIIGFGNVGRSVFLEALKTGLMEVGSVSSSKGSVIVSGRRVLEDLESLARNGKPLSEYSRVEIVDPVKAAVESGSDLAFVTIPPNYETGEPNRSILYRLAESGVNIVLSDKTVLALDYNSFMSYASARGVRVGYRATVAAGTPVIDVARGLRYRGVVRIEAVLNATTNYILYLMERGMGFQEAVNTAIKDKLAEPDPRVDTHGWDSAAKLAILLSTIGHPLSVWDVERIPLEEEVDEERVKRALDSGLRIKYVAVADLRSKEYIVKPVELPANDPLAATDGIYNTVRFELEGERIIVTGPVGPSWRTARVMVSEALDMLNAY